MSEGLKWSQGMRKDIEEYLWARVPVAGVMPPPPSVREVIAQMLEDGMIESPKQAWRTLEKWCNKGRYEYGVTLDLGWKYGDTDR